MNPVHSVDSKHPLCGVWIASDQNETGDYYLAEYCVSVVDGNFQVTGLDKSHDEKFVISDVSWDGHCLTFKTLMPSTKRRGFMKIRIVDTNQIELEFTFTETEIWRRKSKI